MSKLLLEKARPFFVFSFVFVPRIQNLCCTGGSTSCVPVHFWHSVNAFDNVQYMMQYVLYYITHYVYMCRHTQHICIRSFNTCLHAAPFLWRCSVCSSGHWPFNRSLAVTAGLGCSADGNITAYSTLFYLYNAILFLSIFMECNVLNTSFKIVQIPFSAQLAQMLLWVFWFGFCFWGIALSSDVCVCSFFFFFN